VESSTAIYVLASNIFFLANVKEIHFKGNTQAFCPKSLRKSLNALATPLRNWIFHVLKRLGG